MATIENLPQELIANSIAEEPSIFDYLNHSDKTNFSIALAGTIHENFASYREERGSAQDYLEAVYYL